MEPVRAEGFPVEEVGFLADEDGNFIVVALRGECPEDTLEVQGALDPSRYTDQDRKLGLDTYCLCMPEGPCHYGGVRGWQIERGSLVIDLDEEAARTLECPTTLRFPLDRLETGQLTRLQADLHRILDEKPPASASLMGSGIGA